MSQFDRCVLSFILFFACLLALREADHLSRRQELRSDIIVSVSGAVRRPGVIRLPGDGRTVHAIDLCGGLDADADAEAVELARPLQDGQHLIVPRKVVAADAPRGEVHSLINASPGRSADLDLEEGHSQPGTSSPNSKASPATPSRSGAKAGAPLSAPMDLNLATAAELESLPGVGPVMAERIIEARKAAPGGTFGSLEELRAIRGIKAKTFLRLRPYLKIEGL